MGAAFSANNIPNIPHDGMQENMVNNLKNIPTSTGDLLTKNYISFLWDCISLLKYCKVALSTEETNELQELTKKITRKDARSDQGRLFEFLLQIRMRYLARFFEGALLTRLSFSYTLHNYTYLQECLQNKQKNLDREELMLFNQQIKDEKIIYEQIFKRYSAQSDHHLDVFMDTFFRAPQKQTLQISGFNKQRDGFSQEYAKHSDKNENSNNDITPPLTGVDMIVATYVSSGDIEACLEKPHETTKTYSQDFLHTICMKLTESEFYTIQKILVKNQHKIEIVSQIPASWMPFERLFSQLKCVRQLKISASIGVSQIDLMVQFIQDNLQLEELFISIDGELSEKCTDAIRDHPSLRYLSLAINQVPSNPNQLRQLKCLKEILVKPDHIEALSGYIQPHSIILKFYMKGFKFTQSSLDLLKPYKYTFISCGSSFQAFAQQAFISLPPPQQYSTVRALMDFQSNNHIYMDAAISLTNTQDLQRIQENALQMTQKYLYLFIAKLVVELQRSILIEQMKLIVFKKGIALVQCMNPQYLIADFYFN